MDHTCAHAFTRAHTHTILIPTGRMTMDDNEDGGGNMSHCAGMILSLRASPPTLFPCVHPSPGAHHSLRWIWPLNAENTLECLNSSAASCSGPQPPQCAPWPCPLLKQGHPRHPPLCIPDCPHGPRDACGVPAFAIHPQYWHWLLEAS